MCVATGHNEPDIVGIELEASQSLVCLQECEEVSRASVLEKINKIVCFQCARGCSEEPLEEREIAHFNLLFAIT